MGQLRAKSEVKIDQSDWIAEYTLIQDAMDHFTSALSVFDGNFNLALFNQKFIDLLEFPNDFVKIGRPFEDFLRYNAERGEYGPGDVEELVRIRMELAEKREPHCFERVREDGTVMEVRGNPLPGGGFVTTYTDITDRKKAETSVANQKALFESVFRDVPDAMVMTNTDREITMCNRAFTRVLGYEFEDVAGKQTALLYESEEEFNRLGRSRFNVDAEESLEPYIVSYRRKSGEVFPGETVGSLLRDHNGNTIGYLGVIRDISERLAAEAALEKSEMRFRGFASAASDFYWEMDADLRFSYFSERFTDVTGVPVERLIGKTRQESGIEADVNPETYRRHLEDLAAHRPFRNFTHPRTLPDGTIVHLSISGAPVFDDEGRFQGYRGTGTDITSQIRAEEARRESEERYRNLVELSPDSIVVHRDGKILYANPAALALAGATSSDQLIGRKMDDFIHPDSKSLLAERLQSLGEEGKTLGLAEYKLIDLHGNMIIVDAVGGPITHNGEPAIQSILRDTTDRRRAEDRLYEAITCLQEGFALYDADDRLVLFNEEYLRLHPDTGYMIKPGMLFEDFVRERVRLGMNVDAIDRAEEHIRERLEQHRNPKGPVVRTLTDGTCFIIKESRTPDGGIVVTETDITAQRRAEQALKESEQRFRDIASATSDYFWEIDENLRFTYVSDRFIENTGLSLNEVIGKTHWELDGTDGNRKSWLQHRKTMAAQLPFRNMEVPYVTTAGTVLYASISGTPIFDGEGTFKGYRGASTDITERKKAEEALWQSKEQYRLVTDALPAAILYLDSNLRYRFANKYARSWFGKPASEIIGKRAIDLLGPKQFEIVRPHVDAVLKGELVMSESEMTHPDGNTRTIACTFVPDFDADGDVNGYFVLGLDVTERKKAELAVQKSEGQLNSVIENVPVGLLLKDPDHVVVRANSTYLDWYGFSRDTIEGIRSNEIEEFQSSQEVAFMNAQEQEVLTTGRTLTRLVERPFADGQSHTVKITKFPVYDQQGNIIMVGSASVDLTEQVQARQDLRNSEVRFRDFAESASDWLWETDENHKFTYVSERYRKITGHNPVQHIGKTRRDLTIDGGNSEKWRQHMDTLENRRSFREFQYELLKSGGDRLNVSISGQPVYDENGNFRGYRGTGRDITEQRRIEIARDTALNDAIEANEAKSKFLANLSHEFRTPLNAILGFSEILKDQLFGPLGTERYEEYADDIYASSEHLLNLINGLLDISAIESGETVLNKEEVAIREIVTDCIQTVTQLSASEGIHFELDISDDLPFFHADRKSIKQVLLNLLSNAIKFTADEGNVTMVAKSTEEHVLFRISDTGQGISTEQLPNVTSPFVKGEQDPYRSEKGWGLGLSICKSLVELHDGEMEIESELGEGTTVTVKFPRNPAGPVA